MTGVLGEVRTLDLVERPAVSHQGDHYPSTPYAASNATVIVKLAAEMKGVVRV